MTEEQFEILRELLKKISDELETISEAATTLEETVDFSTGRIRVQTVDDET